ncbi:hypothetical protein [Thioalkalivibrio sp.]|uniref:hypothetical protein n=1 Tax=Thioalkalivibrio sp. TaxID=2093813 RepID=UPI003974AD5B
MDLFLVPAIGARIVPRSVTGRAGRYPVSGSDHCFPGLDVVSASGLPQGPSLY